MCSTRPAHVGVVAGAGARHRAPGPRQVVVAGERVEHRAQAGVGDLVGQVQHEPEQLVRVAVAPRQQVLGRPPRPAAARRWLTMHAAAAVALRDPPADPHPVALVELRAEEVRLVEHHRRHRAGRVGQRQRQEGPALPRQPPLLAPHREHALQGRPAPRASRSVIGPAPGRSSRSRSCGTPRTAAASNRPAAMPSAASRTSSTAIAISSASGCTAAHVAVEHVHERRPAAADPPRLAGAERCRAAAPGRRRRPAAAPGGLPVL